MNVWERLLQAAQDEWDKHPSNSGQTARWKKRHGAVLTPVLVKVFGDLAEEIRAATDGLTEEAAEGAELIAQFLTRLGPAA
jgi:hypothetical protein